ncbi:NAD(P)H-dependent oxidoreductase [Myxococcus sp. K38C18041901]|uniref:NAD(P)H-dependent oxidoreductase n=1 Tax=Myxococcus guangdongensis TaxID=2906760 RepID=UPI0020A6EEE8|nr:NAD(P)H-dependent oxidoreductase [Myxococcus guangdongensis]MCP3061799.1 NAD(P)H-dependent oxidoreductase [Myxococcus guangdongensis]
MHALIVVAHPESTSLTHGIAARIGAGVVSAGHSFEVADLAAEGFDPRFSEGDLAVHRRQETPPRDVLVEQARIDRSDTLVLVYPVYWWSMPALMKGWIDRVFSNGWAFDFGLDTGLEKKLRHLKVHLIAIAGADLRTYARHGYFGAMKTQIDHGIFDYCGAKVVTSELLVDSETQAPEIHLAAAQALGKKLFGATGQAQSTTAA